MTILEEIIKKNRPFVEAAKKDFPLSVWKEKLAAASLAPVRPFNEILRKPGEMAVIAEIKKASPSKGVIRESFEPVSIAESYQLHGADALSVLTEKYFFQGDGEYLRAVRQKVRLPLLRKDFLFDPWQIYEARSLGADAVLLIMSVLDDNQALEMMQTATALGLHALVEVHDEEEALRAVGCGAKIIGINNRNLHSFVVDIKTTERVIKAIPSELIKVSESGISTPEDIEYLKGLAVDAVLVGEAFMRAENPGEALSALLKKQKGPVL